MRCPSLFRRWLHAAGTVLVLVACGLELPADANSPAGLPVCPSDARSVEVTIEADALSDTARMEGGQALAAPSWRHADLPPRPYRCHRPERPQVRQVWLYARGAE